MKTKKILLSVLICLVMVAALCLSVACNQETKIDMSDAESWGAAVESEEDKNIYVPSNDNDGSLVFDFNKDDTYNATRIIFAYFDEAALAKVKTLVVTAKMTTDNPYPSLIFKVEGTATKADGTKWEFAEVKVKGTTEYTTYEWNFEGYDLTKVTRFLIMADPGVHSTKGKITIKEIYLTDKEVNVANDAHDKPAEAGKAPDPVWNEVKADAMTIGNWIDGTANKVYDVTANEDGTYKVDVHKNVGAGQWDALVSYIHGDAIATAKTFKLVVKGTAGKQILVKPFDGFEKRVDLTGDEQTIEIDIHTFTEDATKDYSKDTITNENKVVVAGLPDVVRGTDTFTIISAEFSTEYLATVDPTLNVIAGANKVITKWVEPGADKVYTVTAGENGAVIVKKAANSNGWQQLRAQVTGAGLPSYNVLKVKLSGMEGVSFVINAFGKEVDYDGRPNGNPVPTTSEVEVVIDIPANLNYAEPLNVFFYMNVLDNDKAETTITIVSATLERTPNEITAENKKVTKWYDNDANGTYTITAGENGAVVVTKSVTGWQQLKADVSGAELVNMKSFKITIKGIKDENISVKPYDQWKLEAKCEPASQDEVTLVIDLTRAENVNFDGTLSILIFYQFNNEHTAPASFTIVSAEFSTEVVTTFDNQNGLDA